MEHSAGYWMWSLVMGGIIGWLAGVLTDDSGFGVFSDIVVGVVGGGLGGWVASVTGLYTLSFLGAFLVALAGAALLVSLTRVIKHMA